MQFTMIYMEDLYNEEMDDSFIGIVQSGFPDRLRKNRR